LLRAFDSYFLPIDIYLFNKTHIVLQSAACEKPCGLLTTATFCLFTRKNSYGTIGRQRIKHRQCYPLPLLSTSFRVRPTTKENGRMDVNATLQSWINVLTHPGEATFAEE
jgi:hypothetical protein